MGLEVACCGAINRVTVLTVFDRSVIFGRPDLTVFCIPPFRGVQDGRASRSKTGRSCAAQHNTTGERQWTGGSQRSCKRTMLDVLISGKVKGTPEVKTSERGNRYGRCRVLVSVEGEDAVLASVTASSDQVETLAKLKDGDAVSIAGSAKLSHWNGKDGETRVGVQVAAGAVMGVYAARQRRVVGSAEALLLPRAGACGSDRRLAPLPGIPHPGRGVHGCQAHRSARRLRTRGRSAPPMRGLCPRGPDDPDRRPGYERWP